MATAAARPYHHGNLRSELLAHAEQALRDGGLPDLSLRELARRAGVSHAAPRRHFADKQALLDALALEGFERLGRELDEADARTTDRFEDRIAAMAHAYVTFATRDAALLDLMFAGKHRPGVPEAVREASYRAFATPMALLGGEHDGEDAVFALSTLQGLAALANANMLGGRTVESFLDGVVARVLAGLAR